MDSSCRLSPAYPGVLDCDFVPLSGALACRGGSAEGGVEVHLREHKRLLSHSSLLMRSCKVVVRATIAVV